MLSGRGNQDPDLGMELPGSHEILGAEMDPEPEAQDLEDQN